MERAVAQLGRLFRAVARPRHPAAAAAVAAALRALHRELVGYVLLQVLQLLEVAGEGGGRGGGGGSGGNGQRRRHRQPRTRTAADVNSRGPQRTPPCAPEQAVLEELSCTQVLFASRKQSQRRTRQHAAWPERKAWPFRPARRSRRGRTAAWLHGRLPPLLQGPLMISSSSHTS